MKMHKTFSCLFLFLCSPAWGGDVPVPVASDSRIKTFVYSENDVFNLVTYYGYQSNIEFGLNEDIQTISLGERSGWQLVPAGRRLFVRALTTNAHTNMTVVTSRHAYQFDLTSVPMPSMPNEELAYVVRFFYPGDRKNAVPAIYTDDMHASGTADVAQNPPAAAAPAPVMSQPLPSAAGTLNYSYTYTGSETLAPVKLYDDGASTYFKFRDPSVSPTISFAGADGRETPASAYHAGDYWVVNKTAARFMVRQGNAAVNVYNERFSHS